MSHFELTLDSMKSHIPILLFAFLLLLISCNKDQKVSKTKILSQSPWRITDLKKNGASYLTPFPTCIADNTYTFHENGTVISDEGLVKCDPINPQTFSYDWTFFSNEDSVSINSIKYKIIELNDTYFIVEYTNSVSDKLQTIYL